MMIKFDKIFRVVSILPVTWSVVHVFQQTRFKLLNDSIKMLFLFITRYMRVTIYFDIIMAFYRCSDF